MIIYGIFVFYKSADTDPAAVSKASTAYLEVELRKVINQGKSSSWIKVIEPNQVMPWYL